VILVNQATQSISFFDSVAGSYRWHFYPAIGWNETTAPVRSFGVVVLDVGLEHRGEMTFVDDEKPVETLGADRPDESFSVRIGSGRSPRGAEYLDAFSTEDLVEDSTERLVPVMHQVLDGVDSVFSSLGEVPRWSPL
jgi:hypothetical protein